MDVWCLLDKMDALTTSEDATGLLWVEGSLQWAYLITGKNWLGAWTVAAADRTGGGETNGYILAMSSLTHDTWPTHTKYTGHWHLQGALEPLLLAPIMGWRAPMKCSISGCCAGAAPPKEGFWELFPELGETFPEWCPCVGPFWRSGLVSLTLRWLMLS